MQATIAAIDQHAETVSGNCGFPEHTPQHRAKAAITATKTGTEDVFIMAFACQVLQFSHSFA